MTGQQITIDEAIANRDGILHPACDVDDCTRPARARRGGLCEMHRLRLRRTGSVIRTIRPEHIEAQIAALYVRCLQEPDPSQCWEWPGYINAGGYGIRKELGENLAHRITWTMANGPIPAGLAVCHTCDNPPCVNPAHLFLGEHADNMRDMATKGRSPGGLPYKLTAADVRQIRDLRAHGWLLREIAEVYGVTRHYVGNICARRRWVEVA